MSNEKTNQKQLSETRLENIGLYYIQRFPSSSKRLRDFLIKRAGKLDNKNNLPPVEINKMIDNIVQKFIGFGYVNDALLCESLIRKYISQGKSVSLMKQALYNKGIAKDLIQTSINNLLEDSEQSADSFELSSAINYVKKRNFGIYSKNELTKSDVTKQLGAMARAGFSYKIAIRALNLENISDFDDDFD